MRNLKFIFVFILGVKNFAPIERKLERAISQLLLVSITSSPSSMHTSAMFGVTKKLRYHAQELKKV
jgi:hypothetical protein